MTDATAELKVTAASDVEVDRDALDASIKEFAGSNGEYYVKSFHKIHDATNAIPGTFNLWAAVLGPFWAASRAIWGMFWSFLILEVIAWVQIGRGAWGNPGCRDRRAGRAAVGARGAVASACCGCDRAGRCGTLHKACRKHPESR